MPDVFEDKQNTVLRFLFARYCMLSDHVHYADYVTTRRFTNTTRSMCCLNMD